jgi:hypothetical protein
VTSEQADQTRMRNQPALTTSPGTTWLVIAMVTALLLTAMFLVLATTGDTPLPWIGIVATVTLLGAMVGIRIFVPHGRTRLVSLAGLYVAMLVAGVLVTLATGIFSTA